MVDKETYVFLGKNDGLRMCSLEEMVNFVKKHFVQCYVNDRMACDMILLVQKMRLSMI